MNVINIIVFVEQLTILTSWIAAVVAIDVTIIEAFVNKST
jgi:hypothetical protein